MQAPSWWSAARFKTLCLLLIHVYSRSIPRKDKGQRTIHTHYFLPNFSVLSGKTDISNRDYQSNRVFLQTDFAHFAPHTDWAACSDCEFEFQCTDDKQCCEKCAKLGLQEHYNDAPPAQHNSIVYSKRDEPALVHSSWLIFNRLEAWEEDKTKVWCTQKSHVDKWSLHTMWHTETSTKNNCYDVYYTRHVSHSTVFFLSLGYILLLVSWGTVVVSVLVFISFFLSLFFLDFIDRPTRLFRLPVFPLPRLTEVAPWPLSFRVTSLLGTSLIFLSICSLSVEGMLPSPEHIAIIRGVGATFLALTREIISSMISH